MNIENKRSNTWFRDDAYSLGVVILQLICHGHPSLMKKFDSFIKNKMRTQKKVFKQEINKVFKKINEVLNPDNDYIIKHLVFLATKLINYDSE